jgi:hypothetical protein
MSSGLQGTPWHPGRTMSAAPAPLGLQQGSSSTSAPGRASEARSWCGSLLGRAEAVRLLDLLGLVRVRAKGRQRHASHQRPNRVRVRAAPAPLAVQRGARDLQGRAIRRRVAPGSRCCDCARGGRRGGGPAAMDARAQAVWRMHAWRATCLVAFARALLWRGRYQLAGLELARGPTRALRGRKPFEAPGARWARWLPPFVSQAMRQRRIGAELRPGRLAGPQESHAPALLPGSTGIAPCAATRPDPAPPPLQPRPTHPSERVRRAEKSSCSPLPARPRQSLFGRRNRAEIQCNLRCSVATPIAVRVRARVQATPWLRCPGLLVLTMARIAAAD